MTFSTFLPTVECTAFHDFNCSSFDRRSDNFVIGRTYNPVSALTWTLRTLPSVPGYTSLILPMHHWLRCRSLSIKRTMSPSATFSRGLNHLPRCWRFGAKFAIHKSHHSLATVCTSWCLVRGSVGMVFRNSGSLFRAPVGRNKSLHVIGQSMLSSDTGYRGRELMQLVMMEKTVLYSSSLSRFL